MIRLTRILLWLAFSVSVLIAGCAGAGVFEPVPYNWMSVSTTVFICSITVMFLAPAILLNAYRMKRWVVIPCLVLATLLPSLVVLEVWSRGFRSLAELDLNEDGSTSLVEIVTAMDVVIIRSPERPDCKEYLDAKTGSHVFKTQCQSVS